MALSKNNSIAAGVVGLAMAFSPAAFADDTGTGQPSDTLRPPTMQLASAFTGSARGANVIFEYGEGFNPELIASAIRTVTTQGCSVSATNDGIPNMVSVGINNSWEDFKDPGAAVSWALTNCKS